MEGTIITF